MQGKTSTGHLKLIRDAKALQDAGVFMLVLEAIPPGMASLITKMLKIPTIGIATGSDCSGQVLVHADMVGNFQPGRFVPKFVKTYADVWNEATHGIIQYRKEVKSRAFPSLQHIYPISQEEMAALLKAVDELNEK